MADVLGMKAKDAGLEPVGLVRSDKEVFRSNLEGVTLRAQEALVDVEALLKNVGFIED